MTSEDSIVVSDDILGGKSRIEGTRISVEQLQEMHDRNDMTPEEISEILPSVTVQDVKSAIQYSTGENL